MHTLNTKNDTIRILFNPISERFCLLDFLLVVDENFRYLAQIIEITNDKYNPKENIAVIKLYFRVNDKGEVFEYDSYTPSKECEVKKLDFREITTLINENNESIPFGIGFNNDEKIDLNIEFLKNNCLIFSDKIENSNSVSSHLALELSKIQKHAVVFDYTGALEIEGAKRVVISKDFKLPLDEENIEYIWEKALSHASLETQAVCRDIFNEIQNYANSLDDKFIRFNKFLKVINAQYEVTPMPELLLLLNKLKVYQKNNIFANLKEDFNIKKTIEKNPLIILDFSKVKVMWHRIIYEYIIKNTPEDTFMFLRVNETNCDSDLINLIYNDKKEINFILSALYGYKKIPNIVEHANNYIMLPTLGARRDFGQLNSHIDSMQKNECLLYGEQTDNFIFSMRNDIFVLEDDNKFNPIKKFKLNIANDKNYSDGAFKHKTRDENFEPQEDVISEDELDYYDVINNQEPVQEVQEEVSPVVQNMDDYINLEPQEDDSDYIMKPQTNSFIEEFEEEIVEEVQTQEPQIQEVNYKEVQEPVQTQEENYAQEEVIETVEDVEAEQVVEQETAQGTEEKRVYIKKNKLKNLSKNKEVTARVPSKEPEYKPVQFKIEEILDEEEQDFEEEINPQEEEAPKTQSVEEAYQEDLEQDYQEDFEEELIEEHIIENFNQEEQKDDEGAVCEIHLDDKEDEIPKEELVKDLINQVVKNITAQEPIVEQDEQQSEEDLILSQIQEKFSEPKQVVQNIQEEVMIQEPKAEELKVEAHSVQEPIAQEVVAQAQDNFSLNDIAAQSVEARFSDVIDNSSASVQTQSATSALKIDEKTVLDLNKMKDTGSAAADLPIYSEKKKKNTHEFKSGDKVSHDKYGTGEVVKVVSYANRSLLQIEFIDSGKRLLDPDIADISLVN